VSLTDYTRIVNCNQTANFIEKTIEAKDVVPNINRTQAAERAEDTVFVAGDLDL